ncbi:MAG: preprotein translocase subunit YajC [Spirochaetes bacterium GWF1_41_5]|nr:MAG: preprotein translocase subunit YajC [Spirochaetes bacterium GWF1_41_5]HBE03234.1 preprotein translocase subunit YajC [Spirochaetia bacterium]
MFDVLYAQAQAQAGQSPTNPLMQFLPLIIIFIIFYFLLIRPQSVKQKEIEKKRAALEKGDRVITSGGIYGKVVKIKNDVIVLEVSNNVNIEVARTFIANVLEKEQNKGSSAVQESENK